MTTESDPNNSERTPQANETLYFKRFITSALTCVASLIAIVYSNINIEPSAQQEFIALAGLILAVPSGTVAFYYYLRLLISRFILFKQR